MSLGIDHGGFLLLVLLTGKRILLSLHEFVGLHIEYGQIVQLLSKLKDSTKDEHLASASNSGVATTSTRLHVTLPVGDVGPRASRGIVAPHVVELVVVVVLTAKYEDLVLVADGGVAGASGGSVSGQ